MHIKHILRLFIIVLLAAVLTAVAAAEQPATLYESGSPAANVFESEPNGGFADANTIGLGDVASGTISFAGDRDTYLFTPPDQMTYLVDIDAQSIGSALDPRVCLYDGQYVPPQEMICNDNSNGLDSLIYYESYGPVYLRVTDANHPNEGGKDYTYKLSIYRPLLVSAATGGTVAGIPFTKSDVLAHHDFADGTERWMLFFDASDLGITQNIAAVEQGGWDTGGFAFALGGAQTLLVYDPPSGDYVPQKVTPYDYMFFSPRYGGGLEQYGYYGPETAGYLFFQYRGADLGLTTAGEKIDAMAGDIEISTTGTATFPGGGTAQDEDLTRIYSGTPAFDGSAVPGLGAEDVVGADGYAWNGDHLGYDRYLLTILGSGRVDGLAVTQKDIFNVDVTTGHVTGIYWSGPAHHFNYNIDAFDAVDHYVR